MSLLTPEIKPPARPSLTELTEAPERPDDPLSQRFGLLYLRSYLLMRALIGFTGLALPIVLIVGDKLLRTDDRMVRASLSGYYYSGMRDAFVGGLSAIAVFLITYKVFERSLNNVLSVIAGLAALAVAYFPTNRFEGDNASPTPLQERLGEATVAHVHYTAAAIFIVSLALISFFFGVQEGRRPQQRLGRRAKMSPRFWRWFHWTCSAVILLAVAYMTLARSGNRSADYSLLIGQIVAIVFFGLSWLTKGLELDILFGIRAARRRWARESVPA